MLLTSGFCLELEPTGLAERLRNVVLNTTLVNLLDSEHTGQTIDDWPCGTGGRTPPHKLRLVAAKAVPHAGFVTEDVNTESIHVGSIGDRARAVNTKTLI